MTTVLPENASQIRPTDVDQLRLPCIVWETAVLCSSQFQDHVPTHDLENIQIAIRTAMRKFIPQSSGLTLKSGAAAILPFNVDFGGVRVMSATAQPFSGDSHERQRTALCLHGGRWN